MLALKITIREESDHWLATWADEPERSIAVPSAADAIRRVRKVGKLLAEDGYPSVIQVHWMPTTKIGHQVVAALAS